MYVSDDIFSYKYELKINIHVGILPYSYRYCDFAFKHLFVVSLILNWI